MNALISPDNTWAIWTVLLAAAAFALWAENTRWGSKLSGAVIAIGVTFVLSNVRLIPVESPAYSTVWSYLVPLAIPLLLFQADLKRIIKEAGPTLAAFAAGAVATVIGTVIAFHVVPLGEEGWKLAGIFCATYVGGSMNFVAASKALGLESGDLLTAGFAADNLVMALYFLVLFALPSSKILRRWFPKRRISPDLGQASTNDVEMARPELRGMAISLALSAALCWLGFWCQDYFGLAGSGILFLTAFAVILATAFPKFTSGLHGAPDLGNLLMHIFFAVIGASANIATVLKFGPILFVFAGLILLIHLVLILVAGKLFKLDLAEIVIASNANMGGPTTAAAMAVARRWQALVIPAILCGTLGYATATFVGVAVGHWLH